jgi:hypothetical protein
LSLFLEDTGFIYWRPFREIYRSGKSGCLGHSEINVVTRRS